MASPREFWRRLPTSVRRTLQLDQARRWVLATGYAEWHNRRVGHDALTVHFFPMRPEPSARIVSVLLKLGMRIGFEPEPGSPTIAWDTGTWFRESALLRLPDDAINVRCLDISKSRVDTTWARVAGYSISVDPLVTHGELVVKPEENAVHGGRIETGPLAKRQGDMVYQRLIDSRDGDVIVSTRAVIIGGEIPLASETRRPYPYWFDGPYTSRPCKPGELWSDAEQETLLRFSSALDLEYGELDVLRDNASGQIYVVDANRTPFKPHLSDRAIRQGTYRAMAPALARLLASRTPPAA